MTRPGPTADVRRAGGRRLRRPLLVVAAAAALAVAAGASLVVRGQDDPEEPAAAQELELPVYLPPDGADGSDERLTGVATRGSDVVAVGAASAEGRTQPIFLRSTDSGQTWVEGSAVGDASATDLPEHVAAGSTGMLVLGTGVEGHVAWASPDGATWSRRALDGSVFLDDDTVTALRTGPDGYLAVGITTTSTGDARGVLWDSADGEQWRRRTGEQLGVPPQRAGDYFEDVAVLGETVVIAAGEYDQDAEVKNNIAFYTSRDGGQSFGRAPTPLDLAGESRAYVRSVVATPRGFLAVGEGGPSSHDGYDVVPFTSPDGMTWDQRIGSGTDQPGDDRIADVVMTPYGAVAVGQRDSGALVAGEFGSTFWDVQDRGSPAFARPARRDLVGVTAVDDVVVAVGEQHTDGDSDALLVRRAGDPYGQTKAQFLEVELPEVEALAAVGARVSSVTATVDGFLAAGSSGSEGALWRSTGGREWEAVRPREGVADGDGGQFIEDVAVAPDGGVTAVGQVEGVLAPRALLVRSTDGESFSVPPAGGLSGPSEYADRVLLAVARREQTTVAVGYGDDGGANGSALAVWSDGEGRFAPASPATMAAEGADDLRGVFGSSRSMADVTGWDDGFVAVGAAAQQRRSGPAAWTSADGRTWALHQLAMPADAASARLGSVVASGPGLIALGSADVGGAAAALAWSSVDGVSWSDPVTLPVGPGRTAAVAEVAAVGDALVAVGTTTDGASGDDDAAAWVSADEGATWEQLRLPGAAAPRPGQQSLAGVAARDGELLLLGSSLTAAAARTLDVRLSLGEVLSAE